jgi:hypothetical protein
MSKSLNGSGSLNLTLNELRLLEIKATKVTGTDVVSLSNLTGNNATFTGTVDIGNMNISGTFGVQNLTVNGTTTIKALNNTTASDNKIAFIQGGTDTGILKTNTDLYYNSSSGGTLTTGTFIGDTTGDVTGNVSGATDIGTVNMTASGNTNIKALNNTTAANNKIAFIQGGTDTGLLKTSTNLYFNPSSTGKLTTGTFDGDVTGDVTGNVSGASNVGTVNMTATGTCNIKVPNNTASSDNKIPFIGGGGTQGNILSNAGFNYNPSSGILSTPNLTADAITISSSAGANGNATLLIESDTDNTVENASPQVHLKKDGGACQCFIKGSNETESSSSSAENNLIFEIDDATGTQNAFYFYDNTTEILKISTSDGITGNLVGNVTGNVTSGITANTTNLTADSVTATNELIIKAINHDTSGTAHNSKLLFLDGDGTIDSSYKIVRSNSLYYNPTNTTLVAPKIQGSTQVNSNLFVMMAPTGFSGTSNGSIGSYNHVESGGATVRNRHQHVGGHLFMDGNTGNNLMLVDTSKTTIYNTLECLGNVTAPSLQVSGTLTAGTLNVGTQSITDFTVTGDLTLSNLSGIATSRTCGLLVNDTANDFVRETTASKITAGVEIFGGDNYLRAEVLKCDTMHLNSLPLNYTETYNTATFTAQSNSFGGGSHLILPTNGTLRQHGGLLNPSGGIFSFKTATSTWGFTSSAHEGLYEINISCYYQNNTNVRATPRLKLYRFRQNNSNVSFSQQLQLHESSSCARMAACKINSVGLSGKMFLQATDTFRIATLLNHTSTDFGDQTTSCAGTDFSTSMTYLGKLTETITT